MANVYREIAVVLTGESSNLRSQMMKGIKYISNFRKNVQQLSKEMWQLQIATGQFKTAGDMFGDTAGIIKLVNKYDELNKVYSNIFGKGKQLQFKKPAFDVNKYLKKISTSTGMADAELKVHKTTWDKIKSSIEPVKKAMKGMGREMYYVSISIMFLGMQIKRTFTSILKTTTHTFSRIMEESGYLGSAVQRLGVHWEYLKFTIGSAINTALEPLLPMITNFMINISKWIRAHPKLTSVILALGTALGTLLTVGGLGGLNMRWITAVFSGTGLAIAGFILQVGLLIAGFIAVGVAISNLQKHFDESILTLEFWSEFFKSVLRGVLRLGVIIFDGLVSALRFSINLIIDDLNWLIDKTEDVLNSIVNTINKIFGTSVGTVSFDNIEPLPGAYGDIIEKYLDWESQSAIAKGGGGREGTSTNGTQGTSIYIQNMNVETSDWEKLYNEIQNQGMSRYGW